MKYTEVGDEAAVVLAFAFVLVLALLVVVVTLPNECTATGDVWKAKAIKAAAVVVAVFVRCRFSDRLCGCSSRVVVMFDVVVVVVVDFILFLI